MGITPKLDFLALGPRSTGVSVKQNVDNVVVVAGTVDKERTQADTTLRIFASFSLLDLYRVIAVVALLKHALGCPVMLIAEISLDQLSLPSLCGR